MLCKRYRQHRKYLIRIFTTPNIGIAIDWYSVKDFAFFTDITRERTRSCVGMQAKLDRQIQ